MIEFELNRSLPKLKKGLRYGVIYVVTSFLDLNYNYDNMPRSIGRVVTPRMLHWLESLTGYKIEVIRSPEEGGTTLMARRINVGNAGKDAVVRMSLNSESMADIKRFADSVTDVLSTDEGDQELRSESLSELLSHSQYSDYDEALCGDMPQASFPEEWMGQEKDNLKEKRSWFGWLKRRKKDNDKFFAEDVDVEDSVVYSVPIEVDEEKELIDIEQQQAEALKAIQAQILDYVTKFHADPSQLINTLLEGKIVIGQKDQLSPLVVNNNLKIVLPNYNEVEVKMPAMCRAIYILFLKHTEGIALRDIGDHRAELEDIYSIVMPGRSEEKAKEAIDNLLDPMSNTLNEYISKIKRCFKSCIINEELASNYFITGKKGEPYRITLDSSLITLPKAVKE